MGIRMDQFMGLNGQATKILEENKVLVYTEQGERYFPDGNYEIFTRQFCDIPKKVYDHYEGMNDCQYDLHEYTMKDGSKVREAVQAEPWSSGPVFFLALQDEKGEWIKETLWDEETINNC